MLRVRVRWSSAEAGSCASGRWVTAGCSCRWPGSAATTSAAGWTCSRPGPWWTRPSTRASPCSTPRTSTATAAAPRRLLGQVLGGRRDQIVLATKFGHQKRGHGLRARGRGQGRPGLHPPRRDRLAAPAAHRLPGPLPAAHAGPGDPDRGNPARADRAGHRGQGALPRALQPVRLADRRRRAPGPAGRHRGVHLRAERVVAAGAGGRGRAGARGPALRAGRAAVLPAGQRPAHREGPARPATGPGHPAGRPGGLHHRAEAGPGRGAQRVGRGARGQPARRGHRRAGRAARLRVGDRRGHLTGPGQGERGRGGLDPVRGRAGRAGRDRAAAGRAELQFLATALLYSARTERPNRAE